MGGVFLTIFRWTDKAISGTNREKAEADIWGNMDDEDIAVFVEVTVSAGRKSRIVATAIRKVSAAHNMLKLDLITGPRFMQTVRFYNNHGGFVFPFGTAAPVEVKAE